jgi:hypothetical protein
LYSAIESTAIVALTPSVATQPRAVDVGGGFDLLSTEPSSQLKQPDAFFPVSMVGFWDCERTIRSVEGDTQQAERVWQVLGGSKLRDLKPGITEVYTTHLILSPYTENKVIANYTVVDRAYEYANRSSTQLENIVWTVNQPNSLQVLRPSGNRLQLDVVWRIVELPNDQGWGNQEFWKVSETNSPAILRAALVKRRFRRNFDEKGRRVVEGLEVVQTFRVLDGIAGTEFPTSTVKSILRYTRPPMDPGDLTIDLPSQAF